MRTKKTFFSALTLTLFVILFALPSMAQKSNFSGSWAFNESKSNLGESRFRMGATKMNATQDATTLSVESVSKNRDGEERTTTSKYTLDGSECQNTFFQNNIRKSKVTWSSDGKVLTINSTMSFEMNGETREMKTSETWKLSDDGKTLTIESKFNTQNGEMAQTRIYDKA